MRGACAFFNIGLGERGRRGPEYDQRQPDVHLPPRTSTTLTSFSQDGCFGALG
jgi:hypothetical protein